MVQGTFEMKKMLAASAFASILALAPALALAEEKAAPEGMEMHHHHGGMMHEHHYHHRHFYHHHHDHMMKPMDHLHT
jgi:hypothetical protein